MKHLGDITKLHGYDLPVVDCIIGGSPCQDLSVAGLRNGLAGERSGLLMEQIRIVKEMREHDKLQGRTAWSVRPRYMVWENVLGALSSPGKDRNGKDFQAVITEITRIGEPDAPDVPLPKKWTKSGCIYDGMGRWSIAWRVHDAQFWGVPQRRKRIALVADFGGLSAPEICFERKGLRWDSDASGEKREGIAEGTEGSASRTGIGIDAYNHTMTGDVAANLNANSCVSATHAVPMVFSNQGGGTSSVGQKSIGISDGDIGYALNTVDVHGVAYAYGIDHVMISGGTTYQGHGYYDEKSGCLKTQPHGVAYGFEPRVDNLVFDASQITSPENGNNPHWNDECHTLHGNANAATVIIKSVENHPNDSRVKIREDGTVQTLSSRMGTGGGNVPLVLESNQNHATAKETEICSTLPASMGLGGGYVPMIVDDEPYQNMVGALCSDDYKGPNRQYVDQGKLVFGTYSMQTLGKYKGSDSESTLKEMDHKDSTDLVCEKKDSTKAVRRLTPLECERLQGFPDGWTDIGDWIDSKGKKHSGDSDSPRYKALGNSIAVGYANNGSGFWMWLLKRISAQYERNATLGSLFDGIGGFPLAWEHFNGKGSAVWASEIEEFPIAVTKRHFPEEEE